MHDSDWDNGAILSTSSCENRLGLVLTAGDFARLASAFDALVAVLVMNLKVLE